MAGVINLRKARKRKLREKKEKRAEANRVQFGRTREEKRAQELKATHARRFLDAHRRGRKVPSEGEES